MTKLAQGSSDIGIVLPLALTQLYFESLDLWPSGQSQGISYSCAFEDCPSKISKMEQDIQISLTDTTVQGGESLKPRIYVRRAIVVAPSLLGERFVMSPADLSRLPYATLCRNDLECFTVMSPEGETVKVHPKRYFEGNDLFAAHEAAKQGIAFAILPEWMVRDDIAAGRLFRLLPGWMPSHKRIEVMISKGCQNVTKANLLADLMIEKMKSIPGIEVRT